MNNKFNIRIANTNDIDSIIEIWKLGSKFGNGVTPDLNQCDQLKETLFDVLNNNKLPFRVWVAEKDDKTIGWQSLLQCRINPFFKTIQTESSTYTIRKHGIPKLGELLLKTAIDYANLSKIKVVYGYVLKSNKASIRMMKNIGFNFIGDINLKSMADDSLQVWYLNTELD